MGEKDKLSRVLIQRNKVFADIVNIFVFQGRQVVKPEELEDMTPSSVFFDEEQIARELVRDVFKSWDNGQVVFSLLGVEAQSSVNKHMPIRMLAYDALAYRAQIYPEVKDTIVPVVSLVLYYGDDPWDKNLSLRDLVKVPEQYKKEFSRFVYDVPICICDISQLSYDQIRMLNSDLKAIAVCKLQQRQLLTREQLPEDLQEIHCDDLPFMLALLRQLSRIKLTEQELIKLTTDHEPEEGVINMLDFAMEVAEIHKNEGIAIGIEQGLEQGIERGIERGIEQGIVRGRREGVLRMHERGFTNEQIADILGLDLELVNEWLKQN